MSFANPTISDFKTYFYRDFPYGTDAETTVLDQDISKAFQQSYSINQGFFPDQATYSIGFLLYAAHNLVLNLRTSSQGLNGQFDWLHTNKSVGSVNEAFQIPQRILDNPVFSFLTKTNYGAQYLQMVLPAMSGQMFTVFGMTKP